MIHRCPDEACRSTELDVQMWLSWNQGKFCDACNRYGAGGGIALQYSNPGFSHNVHQMSGRTA